MIHHYLFTDRVDAGVELAGFLKVNLPANVNKNFVVMAIPRGGVPIAAEIAKEFKTPLDILMVRKISAPYEPDLTIGAIAEDGIPFFNPGFLFNINDPEISKMVEEEKFEMKRLSKLFRENRPMINVKDKNVLLVDDGLATGLTAMTGAKYLLDLGAEDVSLAVPICGQEINPVLFNFIKTIYTPHYLKKIFSLGIWYEDFRQVSDQDVLEKLHPLKKDVHLSPWSSL